MYIFNSYNKSWSHSLPGCCCMPYLVGPQTFEGVLVGGGGGEAEQDSLDDSGKVPHVEEVVGLGRCGQEVLHGTHVHIHGGRHHLQPQPQS